MRARKILAVIVAGLSFVSLTLVSSPPAAAAVTPASGAPADQLVPRLRAIPGMRVVGERPADPTMPGVRVIDLLYAQPADHRDPTGQHFEQRLTLLHRGFDRPTVAYTTGYNLPDKPHPTEPTKLVDGNQINIEHRFFEPSRPNPANWSELNIWQSAADEHQLISVLKHLYAYQWITTGASKGGMTAVYHHRFYPQDVDGTVAYVAPDEINNESDRYDRFLNTVGTDPACREGLREVQRQALLRRDDMLAHLNTYARQRGYTFDRLVGNADRGLEMTVLDVPFTFWQYRGQQECSKVPKAQESTDKIFDFLDQTVQFSNYTDQGLDKYLPYNYQAGTQLGWPHVSHNHLAGLLHNQNLDEPRSLVPRRIPMRYEPWAIRDVDAWVRMAGSRLMFVYGGNDPWSAQPFELGPGSRDSYRYVVAGGNHGSEISGLPSQQRGEAESTVRRWSGAGQAPQP